MSQLHFIIDKMEDKNAFMKVCYFETSVYGQLQSPEEWTPTSRVLVDSDQKHLIYVVDTPSGWEYIRFPLKLWKQIDEALAKDQDIVLVTSLTDNGEAHQSFLLKDFRRECLELIENMKDNANYGEDMADIVEDYFATTLENVR
ncbi:hypothetical protein [Caldalkalibacillus salinus]|uniref:UPF0738 family protein n=1 Tax=Caldalkalibacillus salinus TaxID=2803787 RepID=UPI00192153D4|nr:hypothetical protein [Caldalkalibacillus salinus]